MRNRRLHALLVIVTYLFSSLAQSEIKDQTLAESVVITVDGEEVDAFFNDGDTFKILSGDYEGSSVRVAGFNTLENYGPVHEWKGMSAIRLNRVANKATQLARKGGWHCRTLEESDSYGRMLADCNDLALALITDGLAHAFSMDETSAKASFLRAQRLAQKNKQGMWMGGIPDYIITSLHSADNERNTVYNRLISTTDGHTQVWEHSDTYETCESVCSEDGSSCMVYVPYNMRYGSRRPHCLQLNNIASTEKKRKG